MPVSFGSHSNSRPRLLVCACDETRMRSRQKTTKWPSNVATSVADFCNFLWASRDKEIEKLTEKETPIKKERKKKRETLQWPNWLANSFKTIISTSFAFLGRDFEHILGQFVIRVQTPINTNLAASCQGKLKVKKAHFRVNSRRSKTPLLVPTAANHGCIFFSL